MKAPPPIKPQEKLPLTYHLTLQKEPEKGSRWWCVVLTEQQGDKILRRKVLESIEGRDLGLDEFMRVATRVFYLEEGQNYFEDA